MNPFATAQTPNALLFWISPEGRFLDASQPTCRAFGYCREELLAMAVWDIDLNFLPDGWPDCWRKLRQAKTCHFQTTYRHQDGSQVPVEVFAHYLEFDGRAHCCALVHPLTAQRQTENALRESEDRLALALAVSNQGLYDLDIATGRVTTNDEYARMLGYEPSESELTAVAWANCLHPEDRERTLRIFKDCITGRRPQYQTEFRLRTRAGDWIWVLSAGKIVQWDATGRPLRLVGTHLDITERKRREEALRESEERFAKAFHASPAPLCITEIETGRFLDANARLLRMLDYTREQLIGHTTVELGAWIDPGARERMIAQLLVDRSFREAPMRFRTRTGAIRQTLYSAEILRLGEQDVLLSLIYDITDRTATEAQLRYHLDLEQAVAEISALMIKPDWEDFDARMNWTLERIGRLAGADRSYLFMTTPDGLVVSNTHEWCAPGIAPQIQNWQNLSVADYPFFHDLLQRDEVLDVQTARLPDDDALKAVLLIGDVRSLLCVPVNWRGKLRGFIGFDAVTAARTWSEEEIRLLRMVAEIVAHTLQHIESDHALRDNARFLKHLDRISRILTQREPGVDILAELAAALLEIFQVDRVFFLYPCDPDAASVYIAWEANRPEYSGAFATGETIIIDDAFRAILQQALRHAGPVVSHFADASKPPRLARHGIQSQMAIALYPHGDRPWLLGLHQCAYARSWTAAEQRLFQVIAERVSDALSGYLLLKRLQESEERYRVVFENAHDAIIVHDFQGAIRAVNQTMLTLYGLEYEEALAATIFDLSGPDSPLGPPDSLWARVSQGEILHLEWKAKRPKDGGCFPVEVMLSAIQFGGRNCILVNVRDITERKRAEAELQRHRDHLEELVTARTAELRQAMAQLVQAEKLAALGSLVAGVAHELNTPLGNVRTVASALSEDLRMFAAAVDSGALRRSQVAEFLDRGQEAVDLLERNTARAADLIGHFKQVAVDQTSVRRRRFNLRQTVEELLATLYPQFKRTTHRIEVEIPPDLELDSYPGPLEQVLANLVNNSLVHGFAGREAGCIRLRALALDPHRIQLRYADDGIGIPEPLQARIFDPFFTTRLGQGGSGLGLYIVYNVVTSVLGGTIQVESSPDHGTTFTLTLPRTAPDRSVPR